VSEEDAMMNGSTIEKVFLTPEIFAKTLNISMSTLSRGVRSSTYPFNRSIKIGRKRLFPASLVVELQECANNPERNKIGVIK
jgi:hypothetical protein